MQWFAEYSPARKRAWIIDADGFTVIGPCISSLKAALAICRAHNAALDFAAIGEPLR